MKKNIHVVEDNDDIREVLELLLDEEGYSFFGYNSSTTFKERNREIPADLFILDVMLPDGNGIDICADLKSDDQTKNIPVMMMSANMDPETMRRESEAQDFVKKPFDIDDLLVRIAALL